MEELYKEQFELYDKIMSQGEKKTIKTRSGKEIVMKVPTKESIQALGHEGRLVFELSKLNKFGIPRYHIEDSENPKIIDVYIAYPKSIYGDLKLIYENGYVWLWSPKRGKLFMSMHGFSNDEAKITGILTNLITRRDTPCPIFDELD